MFLLVAGIAVHFAIAGMMDRLRRRPVPTDRWTSAGGASRAALEQQPAESPFPRLQISPSEDLKVFRAREEHELTSYGWVNRSAGVVRLPIGRAMDLLIERGLPTSNGTNGVRLGPSSYELQQQRSQYRQPEIQK